MESVHSAHCLQGSMGRSAVCRWAPHPAYTSQDCSSCGHRQPLSLSDRTYTGPCCGLVLDRDENARLNMLRLGATVSGFGLAEPRSPRLSRGELSLYHLKMLNFVLLLAIMHPIKDMTV